MTATRPDSEYGRPCLCLYASSTLILVLLVVITSVSRDEVEDVDVGDVIAAVDVYCLEETDCDPGPQHHDMVGEEQDAPEETHAKYWKMA